MRVREKTNRISDILKTMTKEGRNNVYIKYDVSIPEKRTKGGYYTESVEFDGLDQLFSVKEIAECEEGCETLEVLLAYLEEESDDCDYYPDGISAKNITITEIQLSN